MVEIMLKCERMCKSASTQQIRLHIHLGNEHLDIGVRGEGTEAHLVLDPTGIPLHEVEELPSC